MEHDPEACQSVHALDAPLRQPWFGPLGDDIFDVEMGIVFTAADFAKPVELLLAGEKADAAAALADVLATALGGPLAGAAARTTVQHLARVFTDTATKRFVDAENVWDSEQAQHEAIVAYLTDAVGPWFESLREQLNELPERSGEQFLQTLRFIERNVATREDQELSLVLLRELVEMARAGTASSPPLERPVPFDGPGRVPAKPVPNFSADDELGRLGALLGGSNSAICIVAQGMGGIGKTVLAQHYVASHAREHFPAGAVWLDAEDLARDLPYAARCFGWIDQRDPTLDEAHRYLSQELHAKRALIVVDNVDPTVIDVLVLPFPGGRSRTLLTSRHITLARTLAQSLQVESVPLELPLWTLPRCCAYLRKVAPEFTHELDEALDALSEFVGHLPLALQLIASHPIHDRGISATDLLEQIRAEPIHTLERFVGTAGGLTHQSSSTSARPGGGTVENPEDLSGLIPLDTWLLNCDRYRPEGNSPRRNTGNVFLSSRGAANGKFRRRSHKPDIKTVFEPKLLGIHLIRDLAVSIPEYGTMDVP